MNHDRISQFNEKYNKKESVVVNTETSTDLEETSEQTTSPVEPTPVKTKHPKDGKLGDKEELRKHVIAFFNRYKFPVSLDSLSNHINKVYEDFLMDDLQTVLNALVTKGMLVKNSISGSADYKKSIDFVEQTKEQKLPDHTPLTEEVKSKIISSILEYLHECLEPTSLQSIYKKVQNVCGDDISHDEFVKIVQELIDDHKVIKQGMVFRVNRVKSTPVLNQIAVSENTTVPTSSNTVLTGKLNTDIAVPKVKRAYNVNGEKRARPYFKWEDVPQDKIVSLLSKEPLMLDILSSHLGINDALCRKVLSDMEKKGLVYKLGRFSPWCLREGVIKPIETTPEPQKRETISGLPDTISSDINFVANPKSISNKVPLSDTEKFNNFINKPTEGMRIRVLEDDSFELLGLENHPNPVKILRTELMVIFNMLTIPPIERIRSTNTKL